MGKRLTAGVGASAGAFLALPAAAQAEDFQVTNLNDDGAGSLRSAIEQANSDGAADRILFRSKLSGRIEVDGAQPVVTEPVAIVGPGARRVTLQGTNGPILSVLTDPGENVSISGLTLNGGASLGGGALGKNDADLYLSEVVISNSQAGQGGGLLSNDGNVTIERSTISGNHANGNGGGIRIREGDLTILNSTISGNTAGASGGGVYFYDTPGGATFLLRVRNSTVTDNSSAVTYGGGGIYEYGLSAATSDIRGTIVAGNSDADGTAPDIDDGPWGISFSLIGDTNATIEGEENLFGVDPKLKPLKDNGGPTKTHAFKKSPAKNKGPSDAPNSDQRGAPRKGKPDIGAYELAKCEGVIVNRVGTAGKDKLKGTKKKDGILGLGGNDKLSGKKGKDGLCGGSGKDKLKGGPGKDKLNGGPGKDKEVQ